MIRKHCRKRRNCSLRVISPFPTVFSKDYYCRHVKTRACLGKGYTCRNDGRKSRKCGLLAFTPLPTIFDKYQCLGMDYVVKTACVDPPTGELTCVEVFFVFSL